MARFIILYNGPASTPDTSHAGWIKWFKELGNKLTDKGSPIKQASGVTIAHNGATTESSYTVNGYGVITANNIDEAIKLVSTHPFLANGDQYKIELFELGH